MLEYDSFTYVHGEALNHPFQTTEGWVAVVADIRLHESLLHLDDFAIWPLHTRDLHLPVRTLFQLRQALVQQALCQGYNEVECTGLRLAESRPKRTFYYRWRL